MNQTASNWNIENPLAQSKLLTYFLPIPNAESLQFPTYPLRRIPAFLPFGVQASPVCALAPFSHCRGLLVILDTFLTSSVFEL